MRPQQRSILIVDDDPEIRHALRLLFEFESFEVLGEADDALVAVGLARSLQPRFIILDLMMPKMRGDEAVELLRAVAPESRIVAFSAWLNEKPAWADAFLNKERVAEIAPLLDALLESAAEREKTASAPAIGDSP